MGLARFKESGYIFHPGVFVEISREKPASLIYQ
jgi:hypothetical protein